MASESTTIEVGGPNGVREIRISNPSRVIWPQQGITKLDLASYLAAVGGPFVEANGDRPIALQRFGGDVEGEFFFSKNPPKGAPEWIRSGVVTY
ncbi:MAG: ATP-dependent DNA ligase, partial [Amnibacterium sp.]